MANRYSILSGLASSALTWNYTTVPGDLGVPVSGDRVLISSGHTVTLDGTFEWGDDSTSTVVINSVSTADSITVNNNAVLKASRTVNSQLTCKGNLKLNCGAGIYGTYDAGTSADPIPTGVTHNLVLNKSATPAAGKYGFDLSASTTAQPAVKMHGTYRARNAQVTSGALSVGDISCIVSDATGWEVGDVVIFAATSGVSNYDSRTITTITPGSGTAATITFAALTYAHSANCPVGNFTSNVNVRMASAGYGTYICIQSAFTSGAFNGNIHFENVLFEGYGGSAASIFNKFGLLTLMPSALVSTALPIDPIKNCAFHSTTTNPVVGGSFAQICFGYYRQNIDVNDCSFFCTASGVTSVFEYQASKATFNDCCWYRTIGIVIQSSYSQGGINFNHNRCKFFGLSSSLFGGSGFAPTFTDCVIGYASSNELNNFQNPSEAGFIRCDFGYTFPKGTAVYVNNWNVAYGQGTVTYTDCLFDNNILTRPRDFRQTISTSKVVYENVNADVTRQEIHKPAGTVYRDNNIKNRGTSSIRIEPETAATNWSLYPVTQEISIPASNNKPITVIGYVSKNAAYGSATRPSVTLSGLDITPQTFTISDSADTWEQFSFTATQTSGNDGSLTLTLSAQSINAGAKAYFDGVPMSPFVTAVRHYGYVFQESSVTRTVDPVSVLSESAALALTGLSIDYGTQTLVVTGQRSLSEIYDFVHASLVTTANLTQPEFFTSADGVNFNCSFNLVLDGGEITSSGAIAMASKTLTVLSGGKSAAPITHSGGVFTSIAVSGYTLGARLQVYDVTAASELYNGIPTSAQLSLPINWTVNHTIRVRMARVVGLDADKLIQTYGNLTAAGSVFLLTPEPDTVYESNGIDGDTVTEFTADFPNVQIDVSDPDGSTTPQRGYAWYMAGQMTAAGIANFHGGMTADDAANYRINVNILDMKVQNISAQPCIITGARLYRSDGTSIFAEGTGPIQADPSKAYLASAGVNLSSLLTVPKFLALK